MQGNDVNYQAKHWEVNFVPVTNLLAFNFCVENRDVLRKT